MKILINENGKIVKKSILIGREQEKKELRENFFEQGKSCSLTGPNGIGKTYLKDWVKKEVTPDLPNNIWVCEYVIPILRGDAEQEKTFWKRVVTCFPDADDLEDREFNIKEKDREFIDSKGKKVGDSEAEIESAILELLKKYQRLGVEIRLILDEFGRLKGNADSSFFDTLREVEENAPNFAVLYISREQLEDVVDKENEEFGKNIAKKWLLSGFTRAQIMKLATEAVGTEAARVVLNNQQLGECCGLHPDSWWRFYERLMNEKSVTERMVNEVLKKSDFINALDAIAKQMFLLMRDTCMKKAEKTYLQAFYDAFIKEPKEVNYTELKELLETGYIVRMPERYLGEHERLHGICVKEEKEVYVYLPISIYVLRYIEANYPINLPAEPIDYVMGTVEDGNAEPESSYTELMELRVENALLKGALQGRDREIEVYRETKETLEEMFALSYEDREKERAATIKSTEVNAKVIGEITKSNEKLTKAGYEALSEAIKEIRFINTSSAPSLDKQIEQATAESKKAYEALQSELEIAKEETAEKEKELKELRLQKEQLDASSGRNAEELNRLSEEILRKTEEVSEWKAQMEKVQEEAAAVIEEQEEVICKLRSEAANAWECEIKKKYSNIFEHPLDAEHIMEIYDALYAAPKKCSITKEQIESTLRILEMFDFGERFRVAFFTHELFCDMNRFGLEMDYSILTMLYSRMYESFLKMQHYRMYQVALKDVITDVGGRTFASIKQEQFTIAKFSFPLHITSTEKQAAADAELKKKQGRVLLDKEQKAIDLVKGKEDNFNKMIAAMNNTVLPDADKILRKHVACVSKIADIRNDVMHKVSEDAGSSVETVKLLQELLECLFEGETLVNISKLRDAFELREYKQEVYEDCTYKEYVNSQPIDLKKSVMNLIDGICNDAGLLVNKIVKEDDLRLYDSWWTSQLRWKKSNIEKRRYVKTYRLHAEAPAFSIVAVLPNEDSRSWAAEIGLPSETGYDYKPLDIAKNKIEAREALKELWKKYVEDYGQQGTSSFGKVIEEVAVTEESATTATESSDVPDISKDDLIGQEVEFTKKQIRSVGQNAEVDGRITIAGKQYNATVLGLSKGDANTKFAKKDQKAMVRISAWKITGYEVRFLKKL